MRRTILLPALALVGGLALGTLLGGGLFSASQGPRGGTGSSIPMARAVTGSSSVLPSAPPLDTDDNGILLERAESALTLLKAEDFTGLSALVHPEKGLTLTPFSTVSAECDRTLSSQEVSALSEDEEIYVWGVMDGSGMPIRSTCSEYFDRFVFNADYTQAPEVGVDTVVLSGNALENVSDAYPQARFVDYSFPGIDPEKQGYDWCSLKLVFEPWQNDWYLVGLVHSEWTT